MIMATADLYFYVIYYRQADRDRNVLPRARTGMTGNVANDRKEQHAGDHDGMAAFRRIDGR
jgi:hypothetical protein